MYRPSCLSYVLLVANMWSFAVCANAFIYGSYDPSHNIPIVALMTLCATGLWLSTSVVSFGIRYVRVRVSPEKTQNRTIYVSSGLPHFDPVYGVVKKCEPMGGGPAIELQVNPSWIHLLPTSPAINKVEVGQESAILGSTYSVVETGGEPKSLVAVKSGDSTLGFGARVYHEGMDVLMVPHHVWYNDKPHTALAKNGRSVDTEDWEVEAACADPRIDFVLVKVPTAVWAKLAVRSTKVLAPVHGTAVQTFGGQDSKQLFSGLGKAKALDNAWEFTHTAPTAKGWSGTPLYTRDGIVGMHTGYVDIGTSNRAINMHFIMSCLVSKMETLPPELGYREISLEDVGLRSFEFLEVEIENRGKVKLGKREFAWVPKGKAWADMLDDDDLPLPPKMVNGNLVWADAQESFDGALPLNCLRAAGRNVLPPKLNLVTINSPVDPPTKQVACPSEIVDHRLASLEKCLENLLQTLSQPQQKFSQNSLSSGGLKGDQELKLAPCYSKQESLFPPKPRATSSKPITTSSPGTPGRSPLPVSGKELGPSTQSSSKLSRKQRRRRSTKRPVQGSPSPASPPPTRT
ncbi:polyprotein P2a [Southern cowpea mosaic virus]|uniref:Polyprotein P2A n=3 Tax=Southern cowpea mosaic virus TaxID=196398 RepID=P2A_SCPMV|nr:polyprotein P2a [Southern cowpea mosaic virus]Q83470.2 RecName: Full=Polyprotein P2A; Contains: RecName: Full=N-terminal protein; Contains: RecName: Full=Serine protease; Contains: RecName: Full=VPg; Contains: RecName: Full=Putative protein p10; Contains: RecName: Full=Putative protein p8 [Southern cowpea mosaic virus]